MHEFTSVPMKNPTTYLDVGSCYKLEEHASSERNRLIVALLFRCGLRASEVASLKRKDIQIDQDNRSESTLTVWAKAKKENKVRQLVYINIGIQTLLFEYIKKFGPENYIFPSWSKSGHISRVWIQKIVQKAGKNAGIEYDKGGKKIHPHTLRHSLAIFLVKRGVHISKVQQILRHKSLSSTSYYLIFSQKEVAADYHKAWINV